MLLGPKPPTCPPGVLPPHLQPQRASVSPPLHLSASTSALSWKRSCLSRQDSGGRNLSYSLIITQIPLCSWIHILTPTCRAPGPCCLADSCCRVFHSRLERHCTVRLQLGTPHQLSPCPWLAPAAILLHSDSRMPPLPSSLFFSLPYL